MVGRCPGPPKTPSKKDSRGSMGSLTSLSLGHLASRDLYLSIFLLKALRFWGQCVSGQARTNPSYHLPACLSAFLLSKGSLAGISAPHLFFQSGQSPSACPLWQTTTGRQGLKSPAVRNHSGVWVAGGSGMLMTHLTSLGPGKPFWERTLLGRDLKISPLTRGITGKKLF